MPGPDRRDKEMSKLEALLQQLCPDGVKHTKLQNVCIFQNGFAFKSSLFKEQGEPILRIANISDGEIDEDSEYVFFDSDDYKEDLDRYRVFKGDIVVAMSGATTGKIGYNYSDKTYYLNQRVGMFVVNEKLMVKRYLYHWLCMQSSNILNAASGSGAQPNLSSTKMMEFLIPLPPLEVQREIVRILDQFTELTAELTTEFTARKKQYEYYRDELFRTAKDAEIYYLNEISENCDNQRKPVTSGNRTAGKYPYYGASGIVDYVDDYIFDGDYLLISEDGANLLARSTPIAFSISGKNWVNNHAHVLHFDTYEIRRYVEIYLNSIDLSPYITGGAQPKLNQKNLNIALFGAILRMRNLLLSFYDFKGKELISERDLQDYLGRYQDLRDEWVNRNKGEKEDITDDIVFEIELIRQIEINIDYILMLLKKYHDSNCDDKEILVTIQKAVDASPELRSKKQLIETFIAGINDVEDVMAEWHGFVAEEREKELAQIIQEEKLKEPETRKFLENAFRDGEIKTTGTDIDKLMPPVSRFGGGGARAKKKQGVIERLKAFFERFFGI